MGTYRLKPRARKGPLTTRARALMWAAASYATFRAIVWLADRWPWTSSPLHLVGALSLLALVFNLLKMFGGDFGDQKYRDTFSVTVTPEGLRRISSRGQKDVFFARNEITGFRANKYAVVVTTMVPFRRLVITRDLERFDEFTQELIDAGIPPVITTNWSTVAAVTGALGVIVLGTGLMDSFARSPGDLAFASALLISAVTVVTWLAGQDPERTFIWVWALAASTIFSGLDTLMKRQGHGFGDTFFLIGLLLSCASPWLVQAAWRRIPQSGNRQAT